MRRDGRHLPDGSKDTMDVLASFALPIEDGVMCHYCLRQATTRDHIVAKSRHGADAWWNLVPSCRACNWNKGTTDTACTCAFCLRAIRLWDRGYRRGKGGTVIRFHRRDTYRSER